MNIKIKEAEPKEAKKIDNLIFKVRLKTYSNKKENITKKDIKIHPRFQRDFFSKNLAFFDDKNKKIIVAKKGNKILGICFVEKGDEINKLKNIHILNKFHRLGIGKMLWQEALKFLGKDNDIEVILATYNNVAIKFYESLGFKDTGERYRDEDRKMKNGSIMEGMRMVLRFNLSGTSQM